VSLLGLLTWLYRQGCYVSAAEGARLLSSHQLRPPGGHLTHEENKCYDSGKMSSLV
jgi:hypothetical protein